MDFCDGHFNNRLHLVPYPPIFNKIVFFYKSFCIRLNGFVLNLSRQKCRTYPPYHRFLWFFRSSEIRSYESPAAQWSRGRFFLFRGELGRVSFSLAWEFPILLWKEVSFTAWRYHAQRRARVLCPGAQKAAIKHRKSSYCPSFVPCSMGAWSQDTSAALGRVS
jgi:hypothetical protein